MRKKLTITIDERVYEGLYQLVGPGRISKFIESLVRPQVLPREYEFSYAQLAQETEREAEALDWTEALISDIEDEKA